jgi:hypothetical protein
VTAGIIDLDAARPARVRTRSRAPWVAAVLVLVLASAGASVRPPPVIVRLLAAGGTAAAAFALGPDRLYLAQFGDNPNSVAVLRAYRLPDGARPGPAASTRTCRTW